MGLEPNRSQLMNARNLSMDLFNMRAFHAALDEQRRARGLSWTQLAAEINRRSNQRRRFQSVRERFVTC